MDNEEIIIDEELQKHIENGEFSIKYDYLPYSHWRIKEVFLAMGIELRPYFTGYKAMRYRSCQNWVLVELNTNTIVGSEYGYTLEQLRYVLANANIPLHSETDPHKRYRNQGAVEFLRILNNMEEPTLLDEEQGADNE